MKMKTTLKLPVLLCVVALCSLLRVYILFDLSQYQTDCYCEKCLSENDPWFKTRFNKSVQVFLTADYQVPEDNFMWWKRVQGTKANFSVFTQTVGELFKVIPRHPNVTKAGLDGCTTCAVVGNSVTLKGSRYGPLINFHDVVMRINYAPVRGWEADVGNKTTHRIMYPESSTHLDNSTRLVMFPFKLLDLEWLPKALTTGAKRFRSKIRANKDLAMVVNPTFMRYVHESWLEKKGHYPSTGFLTLVLALHVCDEVRVFGFGANKDGDWNHYWHPGGFKNIKTGSHPGSFEYETIQKLAEHQIIQFFPGW